MEYEYRAWNYQMIGGNLVVKGVGHSAKDCIAKARKQVLNSSDFRPHLNRFSVVVYNVWKKKRVGKWIIKVDKSTTKV